MMQQRALLVVGSLLLIGGIALFWSLVSAFFASGDCVSSGGSYDYAAGICDFSENHQFVPFFRTWSFWLGLAAIISGGVAIERGTDGTAA